MEGLRRNTKSLSTNIQYSSRDLIHGPPEQETGMLPIRHDVQWRALVNFKTGNLYTR